MTFSLITAGGTIDKVYGSGVGVYDFHIGNPVAPAILENMLHAAPQAHFTTCKKDSLDMTEGDRKVICRMVQGARAKRILITHGTDTLIETAKALEEYRGISKKRIVLVGASQPARMVESDAAARLGFALGVLLSSQEPGIIIAMDGIHSNLGACVKGQDGVFRS